MSGLSAGLGCVITSVVAAELYRVAALKKLTSILPICVMPRNASVLMKSEFCIRFIFAMMRIFAALFLAPSLVNGQGLRESCFGSNGQRIAEM